MEVSRDYLPPHCIPRDEEEPRKRAVSPDVRLFPSEYFTYLLAQPV